jgi:hypothetical protein
VYLWNLLNVGTRDKPRKHETNQTNSTKNKKQEEEKQTTHRRKRKQYKKSRKKQQPRREERRKTWLISQACEDNKGKLEYSKTQERGFLICFVFTTRYMRMRYSQHLLYLPLFFFEGEKEVLYSVRIVQKDSEKQRLQKES